MRNRTSFESSTKFWYRISKAGNLGYPREAHQQKQSTCSAAFCSFWWRWSSTDGSSLLRKIACWCADRRKRACAWNRSAVFAWWFKLVSRLTAYFTRQFSLLPRPKSIKVKAQIPCSRRRRNSTYLAGHGLLGFLWLLIGHSLFA